MKLAIMQPYFFPYVGYFGLIDSVDKFVFYDDVDFIKNGWINRNRIFVSGKVGYMTIPLLGASSNQKIRDVQTQKKALWSRKLTEAVKQSYSKAVNFKACFELFNEVMAQERDSISNYAKSSIILTCEALGLNVEIVMSSQVYGNELLKGEERILDICSQEQAAEYWNLPGGAVLYEEEVFASQGVKLQFVQPALFEYPQAGRKFESGLSILDVMMFNSFDDARRLVINR
jgi:hypothetical protein